MNKKSCSHEHLTSTEFGQTIICRECGIVHLHVQHLSLRFNVENFLGLADTLSEAAKKVRAAPKIKPKQSYLRRVK